MLLSSAAPSDAASSARGGAVRMDVPRAGRMVTQRGEAAQCHSSTREAGRGCWLRRHPPQARPLAWNRVPVVVPVAPKVIGDEDGDGVPDDKDKCPGTPKGVKVDKDGCPFKEIIILKGVKFEYNKATLSKDSYPILDQAAATAARQLARDAGHVLGAHGGATRGRHAQHVSDGRVGQAQETQQHRGR